MGSRSVQLMKNTAIFAVGTFGSKVLVLLVIPFCTHYIDTVGMGIYDMTYTLVTLLQPIAMLSVSEALFRYLLENKYTKEGVFSTWLLLFVTFISLFTILYIMVNLVFKIDNSVVVYLLIVVGCIYQSIQYGLRGLRKNKLFAISGLLYSFIYCLSCIVIIVLLRSGYEGLLYSMLIATVAATVFMLIKCPDLLRFSVNKIEKPLGKEMTKYSVFLLPNQLSWWALNWFGRVIVVGFLGYGANGLFSVAMKFPSALSMLSSVFVPAWQEQAVSLFGESDSEEYFSAVFGSYLRLMFAVLLPAIPFTALFVVLAMAEAYRSSAMLVPMLYLGASFSAFASFYGVLYLCAKDTGGAASTTVVGAAVNVISSILLIPIIGIEGAAAANMLGNFTLWIARVHQTKRYIKISVPWGQLVLYFLMVVAMSAIALTYIDSILYLIITGLIGVGAALLICRKDLSAIRRVLIRKRGIQG